MHREGVVRSLPLLLTVRELQNDVHGKDMVEKHEMWPGARTKVFTA